ncbi:MAG TPA: polyprenyl synthetase family protein [Bacteroidales bacterium]|nr:polyprenyl synthetase family protein [Bacteroidales bacterium]
MYSQAELKELVEKAIANLAISTEAEKLTAPVKYILSIGGKRLRPVLALMSCNLFRDKIDEAVLPATGLEVFHNFTLVHDDIMDQAPVRRNLPTVHIRWNLNQAILSGDVMAFIANECFLQTPPASLARVFKAYNRAAVDVCIGQQLDMDFEKAAVVGHSEYLRMIEMKTASLIAASAKVGAIIGEAPEKDCDHMFEFGRNLGLAFQIQDDLLDVYGDAGVFGKASGGDIVSNKKTFLLLRALELSTGNTRKALEEQITEKNPDPAAKIRKVTEIYDSLNIREIAEQLANEYISGSLGHLEKVSADPERKKELTLLANSLIGRNK